MTERNWSRVFLGLGGNLGDPLNDFRRARQQLAEHPQIELLASSPLYRTPPVGGPAGQPDYLNAVLELRTSLAAGELLELCRGIEKAAGRTRELRWGPRTLDIDLLLFAGLLLDTPELTIPHPRLQHRHFVLLPLNDLAADLTHPQIGLSVNELLKRLPPAEGISRIMESW
ncbi:MAG: 2-amino-4-hydroxy-6-hydroxymethyldihydropteridine diphosphokinase [Desulfuromonas sp.]|nr:MAG: 2-amino-4-hydroxy-6-hydroxymethyldihydropteridine diphosphokinase [Desulfuromonas sp.]